MPTHPSLTSNTPRQARAGLHSGAGCQVLSHSGLWCSREKCRQGNKLTSDWASDYSHSSCESTASWKGVPLAYILETGVSRNTPKNTLERPEARMRLRGVEFSSAELWFLNMFWMVISFSGEERKKEFLLQNTGNSWQISSPHSQFSASFSNSKESIICRTLGGRQGNWDNSQEISRPVFIPI